jgi:hypothetical protein
MAKHLRCLWLLILLIGSDAYAWYCTYTPTREGWISNLQCYEIDPTFAIETYWCPYRNQDPICRQFDEPITPPCSDRTEVQSLACEPYHSGVVNQSRMYYCEADTYTDWITTSNNCTPDPPTCATSVEERTLACQEGFSGQITEARSSSCPNPYGQPIFGAWVETQRSCQMTTNNPMNVNSPVSPISPLNDTMTQTQSVPQQESQPIATDSVTPSGTVEAKVEVKQDVKSESKEEKQDAPKSPDVPKGKDLVNGFGIVMSLELLNAPIAFQQQQFEIALDYSQELPDGIRRNQEFVLELISDINSNNIFNIGSKRWSDLYRNYEVQPNF